MIAGRRAFRMRPEPGGRRSADRRNPAGARRAAILPGPDRWPRRRRHARRHPGLPGGDVASAHRHAQQGAACRNPRHAPAGRRHPAFASGRPAAGRRRQDRHDPGVGAIRRRSRRRSAAARPAASDLVAEIQTGLRNIAYSDVAVDGIAGEKTKAAIRNFEKNYRLPPTGEPSRRVLDKLKSIGAL